jgi:zinc transport system permease protein
MDDFLWRALLAGVGVALVTGPLGCFVIWRRMAYFGETLAHASLLGVALGLLFEVHVTLAIVLVSAVAALILGAVRRRDRLATDGLLGILSHGALALGLLTFGMREDLRGDLLGYLLGDILAVSRVDLYTIYGGGLLVLLALGAIWTRLLAVTIDPDLAAAEGVRPGPVRLAYMLLLAVTIAVGMKLIGVLLVTALLIIPAATARGFSRGPESMAILASVFGAIAVLLGLAGSFQYDLPSGPAIVVSAFMLFLVVTALQRALEYKKVSAK